MYDAIGAVGVLFILAAFFLNHFKWFKRFTYSYNFMNFVGAAILFYYAMKLGSPVFMTLNAIWMYVAVFFVGKKFFHFTPVAFFNDDIDDFVANRNARPKPKPKKKRIISKKPVIIKSDESKEGDSSTSWPWSK
ncbi:hypothetical protein KKH30_02315 [Candidatus Micrarchaeota archaeon]|nr:hypothetical protein [Candidatus Micrarchaeota archaeon]MBU1939575.1 hypothetical protein [Candidatus Micrarchaeota archaeon]